MKKFLFVSHEGSRTGAPLVLLSLVKAISNSAVPCKISVLFLEEGAVIKDFVPYARVFQIEAHNGWRKLIPYKMRLLVNRKLFEVWAKYQHFDLIYANTVGSLAEGIELKDYLGIPLWLHIHETERTCLRRKITMDMMKQCDNFISVSSLSTKALVNYGVSPEKIQLVRPFSEHLSNTAVEPIKLDGVDEKDFVIGLSGVGGWRKGSDIFPMIVRRFVDKYPQVPCKFIWLGGLNKSETPYDIAHLSIANYVITPGLVSNPMEYYKRFDVFLLTSREDPFPLVCMENAALGNPIVMFEGTSGIADLVIDEQTGLHVPYLDIDAMCDAIYRLYVDENFRKKLGENLRNRLKQYFSKEKSIGQLLKLLENDN